MRCAPARLAGLLPPVTDPLILQGAGIAGVSGDSPLVESVCLEHGYLSCTANASHLVVESRRSSDGSLMDAVTLIKSASH